MNTQKDTSKMSNIELATIIADDQINRGVIGPERRESVIDVWVNGHGAVRPVSRDAMLRIVNGMVFT